MRTKKDISNSPEGSANWCMHMLGFEKYHEPGRIWNIHVFVREGEELTFGNVDRCWDYIKTTDMRQYA